MTKKITTDKKAKNDDTPQELIAHLKELKLRIIYSILALLGGMSVAYLFASDIYQFLLKPLTHALGDEASRRMIFTGLTEAFLTYLKLAFYAGFIISSPIILFQIYAFVAPGLYKNEKMFFAPFLVASPTLFLMGAAMAYYFIFPLAWKFFLSFEIAAMPGAMPIQLEARISEYLSLVLALVMSFGIAFQLPIVVILLVRAGLVKVEQLKKFRRYAVLAIVIFAAIITPPDVISQIGLSIPLYLLYEISIYFSKFISKNDA
jgi:sec-independent protein translocase protein TatC